MKISQYILLLFFVSCASGERDTQEKKAQLFYSHGTSSLLRKEYTDALKYLLEAEALAPKRSDIHSNLGMAYYFKRDKNSAKTHILRSIELDEKNSEARNNLASLYLEEGKLDEAREQYEIVLKDLLYKNQFRTYYNLGVLAYKQNQPDKAIGYFQKSIQERPDYCVAHFQIGLYYFNNHNFPEAETSLSKASLGDCNTSPDPHYYYALSLIKNMKYQSAKIKLEEVEQRFPTSQYSNLAKLKLAEVDSEYRQSLKEKISQGSIRNDDEL